MLPLGRFSALTVVKQTATDVLLDGGEDGEIPLAKSELKAGQRWRVGDSLEVLVFIDDDGYLTATTYQPYAQCNEMAYLCATAVNEHGAWFDWGLSADLFMPHHEQKGRVYPENYYLVRVVADERLGLIATMKWQGILKHEADIFTAGQAVKILIVEPTDLGFKVIVENNYWGLLYHSDIFQPLSRGQIVTGYIKKLREDKRLDITLAASGYGKIDNISQKILSALEESGGFLAIGDHSSPEEIYAVLGVSKKAFKQAIGGLFKQRRIEIIKDQGIKML